MARTALNVSGSMTSGLITSRVLGMTERPAGDVPTSIAEAYGKP